MKSKAHPPFAVLLLLISFASVNAVLFTPALPQLALFFSITTETAQQTLTVFLLGYTLGQLIYGPLANRFGRKPVLYSGVALQIVSSLLCAFSSNLHFYPLLVVGRFLLGLGSGVGLKMTFTLVNETYDAKIASQKLSYLTLAFAFTPNLSVALGGFLSEHWGWASCFYASALYGVILFFALSTLQETQPEPKRDALQLRHLLTAYSEQFKNKQLCSAALLMGFATCFIYLFAALAPFIAINILGISSADYGCQNLLPALGLMLGSLSSAQLLKFFPLHHTLRAGIAIATVGTFFMSLCAYKQLPALYLLFLPMIIIYFGLALILATSPAIALSHANDKSHGSSVMSFINMSLATSAVLGLGLLPLNTVILPTLFFFLCGGMIMVSAMGELKTTPL